METLKTITYYIQKKFAQRNKRLASNIIEIHIAGQCFCVVRLRNGWYECRSPLAATVKLRTFQAKAWLIEQTKRGRASTASQRCFKTSGGKIGRQEISNF